MNNVFKTKRLLAWLLVFVLAFTTIFTNGITAEAASSKAVKKVTVKIGKKTVTKKTYTLVKGKTATLKVSVTPSGSKKSVSYKTNKKSIATVSKKGKVTAKKAGTAKITVTVTGKNKKKKSTWVKIKVVKQATTQTTTVAVTDINATINSSTINVGSTAVISASVVPANATDKALTYTSSNTKVANVTTGGVVTGISAGTAVITIAAKNGVKKTITVTVKAVGVTSVELDHATATIPESGTVQLKATVKPETASNKSVTWSSADPTTATVDSNGLVTGVKEGTTTITATSVDGSHKGSCKVTVTSKETSADGVSLAMTNPYKDNQDKEYPNTALVGEDMTVRARVMANGVPQGNRTVTLTLDAVYGNASSCFEVRQSTVQTDENGYANFVIGLKDQYKDEAHTATGIYYQSFIATAQESSSNLKGQITVKFARIDLRGVVVENNANILYSKIVPSTNASPADDGIATTKSVVTTYKNSGKTEEYVSSQQVSSNEDDHKVYLSAAPYLILPATQNEDNIGDWEYPVNKVSGSCSVYNDETNETTTVQVVGVPAGLQYLTAYFDKIELSKYTKVSIDVIAEATGASIGHEEIKYTGNTSDTKGVQIERKEDVSCYVVVSLISQGQVDVANEGYVLTKLIGKWKTADKERSEAIELLNTVKWTDVTEDTLYDVNVDLSYANAQKYLPANSEFLNETYLYSYSVPSFPNTGDAIITVKDANDTVKAYFLYPTENNENNKNVLVDSSSTIRAIQATKDEVTKKVGTLTTQGNLAIVDSREVGRTNLRAEITIKGLNDKELNVQNAGELYSSIQWAPVPNKQEEEVYPDYYAIEGQFVTVTAQLYDKNGNKKSDAGKNITFKYKNGEDDVEITKIGQTIGFSDNGADTVSVTNIQTETDTNGQAKLQLRGVDAAYVEGLTATVENNEYNVKISLADKEETIVDVYWVDLGLTFVDSAVEDDSPVRTTQFADSEKNIAKSSSSVVGKTWDIGYQVVARSHVFNYSNPELVDRSALKNNADEFMSIKNVVLGYSKADTGADTDSYTVKSNVIRITSEKTGSTIITGGFDTEKTDTSKVVFCFRDSNGKAVQYTNVGTGDPTWGNTKMALNFNWTLNGMEVDVFTANGNNVHVSTDAVVYVRVTDKNGNPAPDAKVSYTVSGVNAGDHESDSQKTDAKGLFKINLPAPGSAVSGSTASSTITVTVDDNKELQKTITIIYNTQNNIKAFGIREDEDAVKAVKMVDSTHMTVYFSNTVDAKSIQPGEFTLTQGGSTDKKYLVTEAVKGYDDNSVTLTINQAITDLTAEFTVKVASYEDNRGVTYDLIDTYGQKLTGATTYTFKPSERGLTQ